MKLKEFSYKCWFFCKNRHEANYAPGKLHVALPIEYFFLYEAEIYYLLKQAVLYEIIPCFKMRNNQGLKRNKHEQGFKFNRRCRLINNPFTIYLFKEPDFTKLTWLCQQLEELLAATRTQNLNFLSPADLPISPHLNFRVASIAGIYISIAKASDAQLTELRQLALENAHFLLLNETWRSLDQSNNLIPPKSSDYPSMIISSNTRVQVTTACEILKINWREFKSVNIEQRKLMIQNQFHKISQYYSPAARQIQNKAEYRLFVLARTILETIMDNPLQIKRNKFIKHQHGHHLNKHQLLAEDIFDKQMAVCSTDFTLNYHWQCEKKTIVITKPQLIPHQSIQLTLYPLKNQHTNITLSGYQALHRLFLARAVSLTEKNLTDIFSKTPLIAEQKWLLKKALASRPYLELMSLDTLSELALRATQMQLIIIGTNKLEIIYYYLLHYPEIFSPMRIEELSKVIALSDIGHFLILHPNIMARLPLGSGDLLISCPEIGQYIWQQQHLTVQLLSVHYLFKQFFEPIFSASHWLKLEKIILWQLFYGNRQYLNYINEHCLLGIRSKLAAFNESYPAWLYQQLSFDVPPTLLTPKKLKYPYYNLEPEIYLKKKMIHFPKIVMQLNKRALIFLVSQPEIHCLYYSDITEALLLLGEEHLAALYAHQLITFLKKPPNYQIKNIVDEIATYEQIRALRNQQIINRHHELKNQFTIVLKQGNYQKSEDIYQQLSLYNKEKELIKLKRKQYRYIRKRFLVLFHELTMGERSQELLDKFQNLFQQSQFCTIKWTHLLAQDDKKNEIEKDILYPLMQRILGLPLVSSGKISVPIDFVIYLKGSMLLALEQLFFVYQCLQISTHFFYHLSHLMGTYLHPEQKLHKGRLENVLLTHFDAQLEKFLCDRNSSIKPAQLYLAYKRLYRLHYLDEKLTGLFTNKDCQSFLQENAYSFFHQKRKISSDHAAELSSIHTAEIK